MMLYEEWIQKLCLPEDKENMIALVKYLNDYQVNQVAHLNKKIQNKQEIWTL